MQGKSGDAIQVQHKTSSTKRGKKYTALTFTQYRKPEAVILGNWCTRNHAVVVREHPGYIPGFPIIWVWIFMACHESCPSAARSKVKARQTRISIKAKQTRISSLLAWQGPHVGYVCSTPQIFIMTDLRRTDTTEFRRRLYVPRTKRASPLCRCSRYSLPRK